MPDETQPAPAPESRVIELLQEATQRLVRAVDGLEDAAWAEPSALPDWTRAHVVAHLALNAEGLAGALAGIVQDDPTPMYASQEARDADIADLAAAGPAEVRTRLLGATTELADAMAAVPDDAWSVRIERVPGGRTFRAASVASMRLREVEIHHADLAAGYSPDDWEPDFAVLLVDSMGKREASAEPFQAVATDCDRSWTFGEGGPTVSGHAAALGWWLTGRGTGEGLTTNHGALPGIGAW
jgi:maleylpyruvate isomerase